MCVDGLYARARLCVWCMRACVSQPDIHLPHTLLAALSYSSPPHPLLHTFTHTSAPPPLPSSVRRSRCWRTGRRTEFLVSILSVPTQANLSPKGSSRWSTSYGIRPTPYVSQSYVSVSVPVLVSVSVSTCLIVLRGVNLHSN